MALRELAVAFGLSVDAKQLDAAEKQLDALVKKAQSAGGKIPDLGGGGSVNVDAKGLDGLVGAFDAAKKAIAGFFVFEAFNRGTDALHEFIKEGARLDDLSQKFGVSAKEIQQFQYAGELAGVEAESMATALGFLQKNVGMAAQGNEEAAKAFGSLHVKLKEADGTMRPLTDIAGDVAENVSHLGSEAEMAGRLVHVFGKQGADLIPVLKGGGKELRSTFEEFERLGGGMDEQFVQRAAEVDDQLTRMNFAFKGLKTTILGEFLPAFMKMAKSRTENIAGLVKLTKETNIVHAAMLALGAGGIVGTSVKLLTLAKNFQGLSGPLSMFGSGLKGIFSLGLSGTLLLGVLAAMFVLFEDLFTLMNGGDSIIGKVWEEMNGAGSSKELVDQLQGAWDALMQAMKDMAPIAGNALKGLLDVLPVVIPMVVWLVKQLANAALFLGEVAIGAATLAKVAKATVSGDSAGADKAWKDGDAAIGKLENARNGAEQSVFNQQTGQVTAGRVGGLFGQSNDDFMKSAGFAQSMQGAPLAATQYTPANVNAPMNVQINVDGSKDPKATGDVILDHMQKQTDRQAQDAWANVTRTGLGK